MVYFIFFGSTKFHENDESRSKITVALNKFFKFQSSPLSSFFPLRSWIFPKNWRILLSNSLQNFRIIRLIEQKIFNFKCAPSVQIHTINCMSGVFPIHGTHNKCHVREIHLACSWFYGFARMDHLWSWISSVLFDE